MEMEEKNKKVQEYIVNLSNKLNLQYNNVLPNDKIQQAIAMFSNSDKEYEDIIQEINSLLKPIVEEYIKYIEYKKAIERLESQIIPIEKDNPYFGEVYKTYVIEVLEKFEEIQNNSEIIDKKEEFEKSLNNLLSERNITMTQLLYNQISNPSRIEYAHSEMFLGAESLTYETVSNLYNTFVNDINIISNDSEGKMYCTVLNNQKIFNADGTINPNIKYNFSLIEKTYDYAQKHGKQIKFHTFLWHNAVPENLKKEIDSIQEPLKKREMTISFLRDYASKLAAFINEKGYDLRQIEALNEIANDDLISPEIINNLKQELITLENESQYDTVQETINKRNQRISEINNILKNDPLRSSWWRDVIGDDYYIETFKILRDNFPAVELIYNEYNEMLPCKAERISKIIDSLKVYEQSPEGKEKYPNGIFDGVGLQGHVTDMHIDKKTGGKLKVTEREILYGLGTIQKSCISSGKKIYITEGDCQNIINNGQSEKNNHVYIETAKKIANGYIVWGNSDKLTWSRMFHPISKENMNGHMIKSNGEPKKGWEQLKTNFNCKIKQKEEQKQENISQIKTTKGPKVKSASFTKRSDSEINIAKQIKEKNMGIKQQKEAQRVLDKPKVKILTKSPNNGNGSSSSGGFVNTLILTLITGFIAGALFMLVYSLIK